MYSTCMYVHVYVRMCVLLADVCDMERAELHSYRLAEKYAAIWKNKTQKCEHCLNVM